MALFPREVEGLEVALLDNVHREITAAYLQRNTPDPLMDWNFYDAWKKSNDRSFGRALSRLPDVYVDNWNYFDSSNLSRDDRLVLAFNLQSRGSGCAFLGSIASNPSPEFVGVGAGFYRRLVEWLKPRGFRFVAGVLLDKPRKYWQRMGYVPAAQITQEKRDLIGCDDNESIHFLYEADRQGFIVK